jgi:hypothetical protein
MSHETAKRYYDRQTKLEQYQKGDLVYLHDPTHKRGKAKKFSYQYKGPYEVEEKISPLIYKIRMSYGTFAIIHVNRLKRSHRVVESDNEPSRVTNQGSVVDTASPKKVTPKRSMDRTERKIKEEIPDIYDMGDEVVNPPLNYKNDPDWNPESLYLQRKLQDGSAAADVAYQLRSRVVNRSGRETEADKAGGSVNNSPDSELGVSNGSPSEVVTTSGHSYNLRSRVAPTSDTA